MRVTDCQVSREAHKYYEAEDNDQDVVCVHEEFQYILPDIFRCYCDIGNEL
jgi:hypothetical protein